MQCYAVMVRCCGAMMPTLSRYGNETFHYLLGLFRVRVMSSAEVPFMDLRFME